MEVKLSINESDLVTRCIAGEERAYSILYSKYAASVYNSVSRMLTNSAEAEDMLQEAFCVAFEQLDRLQNQDNFEGWVKRIAINRTVSFLRKKKHVFKDDYFYEAIVDEEHDISEEFLFQRQVDDVKKAIEALPEGYRTIVSLYLFEEIPQEEIAHMLGLSYSTVRTQYHRAKKKIYLSLIDKQDYGR